MALTREAVEIMHREQLAEHGGLPGLKDENALEAALARPLNKAAYGEKEVFCACCRLPIRHRSQPSVLRWEQAHGLIYAAFTFLLDQRTP